MLIDRTSMCLVVRSALDKTNISIAQLPLLAAKMPCRTNFGRASHRGRLRPHDPGLGHRPRQGPCCQHIWFQERCPSEPIKPNAERCKCLACWFGEVHQPVVDKQFPIDLASHNMTDPRRTNHSVKSSSSASVPAPAFADTCR